MGREVGETPTGLCPDHRFPPYLWLSRRVLYEEGVVPIDLMDESEQQACTDTQLPHPGDPYQHTVLHVSVT